MERIRVLFIRNNHAKANVDQKRQARSSPDNADWQASRRWDKRPSDASTDAFWFPSRRFLAVISAPINKLMRKSETSCSRYLDSGLIGHGHEIEIMRKFQQRTTIATDRAVAWFWLRIGSRRVHDSIQLSKTLRTQRRPFGICSTLRRAVLEFQIKMVHRLNPSGRGQHDSPPPLRLENVYLGNPNKGSG